MKIAFRSRAADGRCTKKAMKMPTVRPASPIAAAASQLQVVVRHRDTSWADHRDAGVLVAELAGDPERLLVSLDRARAGRLGAEPGEGERQHGGAHLGAKPAALELASEPGARRH